MPGALLLCATHEEALAVTHQEEGNKMHLLALVYFPLLRNATGKYIESYADLCEMAISLYNPDDNRPLGIQVVNNPQYRVASDTHFEAKGNLHDQIEKHSAVYVKA